MSIISMIVLTILEYITGNLIELVFIKKDLDYYIGLVTYCVIISFFTYEITAILSIIMTLLIISIKLLINKLMNKENEYNSKKMPVAYYLTVSNVMVLFASFLHTFMR